MFVHTTHPVIIDTVVSANCPDKTAHKVNGYQCQQLSLSGDRNRLNKSNRGKSNPITVRVYGSVKEEQKAEVWLFWFV